MSDVHLINNNLNIGGFDKLKTIKFLARNHTIDKFLSSLNTSIERDITFINDQPSSSKPKKTTESSNSSESEYLSNDFDSESYESDFNESYDSYDSESFGSS